MQFGKARLSFRDAGRAETVTFSDLSYSHPRLQVSPHLQKLRHGAVLTLTLTASEPVELEEFILEAQLPKGNMLSNGYQSWSRTKLYRPDQYMAPLFALARPLLSPYGDYSLIRRSGRRGHFFSWSWTGFEQEGNWFLLGSDAEDWGYTLFEVDGRQEKLYIRRDCQGEITSSYPLLQLYYGWGGEGEVWDEYASLLTRRRPNARRCTGWTSWYNYYTKIDEEIILDNLRALSTSGHPFQIFQIDDGWQEAIGDWLDINAKFPSGLASLARTIRQRGFRPGLWLSPFICDKKSRLWRENYDWVLKDEKGRPVKAGWNPGWNGWFYALDFYAPGFQTWLKEVFATILDQWGFQMVKLDFLYAVALRPHHGRCRGRIMAEAMEFLHQICGDNFILGCGVPLAQSAGRVDFCRIGADVAPYWEDRFLRTIGYRERVSTRNSLASTLHRHMLDRRFFRNDPDVFLLRDGVPKVNENKLSLAERHTLFFLNNLLGGLVFLSDHVGEYTPEQQAQLAEMFPSLEAEITRFHYQGELFVIEFQVEEREYVALVNLSPKPAYLDLPPGQWFHPELKVCTGHLDLQPHQTLCLAKVKPQAQPYVLGSSGHLYPGAQVESFTREGDGWTLTLKSYSSPHTRVWIALPEGMEELVVNGTRPEIIHWGRFPVAQI
jgi:alpha-galactosidase